MGVGVGDSIVVATAAGPVELAVVGLVERSFPGDAGEAALVGWSDAIGRFSVDGADACDRPLPARRAEAASPAVGDLAAQLALTAAPVSSVAGRIGDALDRVFGLLDLLALAAVVVAGFGIANTLSMDSWERIRELGVLRAAGMSRRQVWRSVLVEAGIIGTIGGLVGSVAGLVVGALLLGFAGGLPSGSRCRGDDRGLVSSLASGWRCWPRPSRPGSPAGDRSWRRSGPPDRSARVRGLSRGC